MSENYYLSFYGSVGVEDEYGEGEALAIPKHEAVLTAEDLAELCDDNPNICPCKLFNLLEKNGEYICHSHDDCSLMTVDAWEDTLQTLYSDVECKRINKQRGAK